MYRLQWKKQEKQLLEENRQLKQNAVSSVSQKEFQYFQNKIDSANETINYFKSNLTKVNEEWKKKEMKLIHECDQLRYQLKNSPKFAQTDVERLQEQLKDTQEMNVKLKLDYEACKDKYAALENLCTDLKKVIVDEQIAEKVYSNDNTPTAVKQFLSSSPTSVINTLTQMFGCLSRSATRNRAYCGQKETGELFTTRESLMLNDLKSHEHELIKELFKDKEQLRKTNVDLDRQVKELEKIVRRRAHPNFSNVNEIIRNDESKMHKKESEIISNLKKELLDKQHVIIDLKNQIVQTKAAYDQNLLSLQGKIVNIQEESMKMKDELEKKKAPMGATNHLAKCRRKGRSCDPPTHNVRNARAELSVKEREILALNKQIEELKKTNRKLVKDKENNYVSSKEESSENIQLNNKLTNEKTNCRKHGINSINQQEYENVESSIITSQDLKPNTDNINCENGNLITGSYEVNTASKILPIDKKTPETATMNNSIDDIKNSEPKSQNLQQVICDLFKLLAKEELGDKIKNSNNDSTQPEEVRRFVAAFRSFSN